MDSSDSLGHGKTCWIQVCPGAAAYKQAGSTNYFSTVTLGGVTKVRTTRTTDPKLAIKRTQEFFLERVMACSRGESAAVETRPRNRRFDKLVDDFLEIKRADLCVREWRNLQNLLISSNGPARHFSGRDVGEITTDAIRTYLRHAEANSTKGKLAPSTLKRHVSAISGVLRLAEERQLIAVIPRMPPIKAKDSPRPYFTQSEYRRLCSTAHSLAQRAEKANDA